MVVILNVSEYRHRSATVRGNELRLCNSLSKFLSCVERKVMAVRALCKETTK